MKILYIASVVTDECLTRRNNHKHQFPSGIKKTMAIADLIEKKGFMVNILSPSLVHNNTLKYFSSFDEKFKGFDIEHCACFDLSCVHLLSAITSAVVILTRKRKTYQSVLFYNYRPETAIPALFSKIFLGKKIYLDYEDDLLLSDANIIFKPVFYLIEAFCNYFLSGALVVNPNLQNKLRTNNVQVIEGIFNYKLMNEFNQFKKLKNKDKIFIYSGSLDKYRGVKQYIDIAESVIEDDNGKKNFEFWITGKGPLDAYVHEKCNEYPEHLKYFGFVPDDKLIDLYKEVDCFVVFNDPDSKYSKGLFPSKLYEYLSTGRKVLFYGNSSFNAGNLFQFDSLNALKVAIESYIKGERQLFEYDTEVSKINQDIVIF